jgi:ribonuclease HI
MSAKIAGPTQSNQVGEITTILIALQRTDTAISLIIATDSCYAMNSLTKHLKSHEDSRWIGVTNNTWFCTAAYHL